MNYAEDRLDRRARVVDSTSPPLWVDFRQGLQRSDHSRIACCLKDAGWNAHAIFHYAQAWLLADAQEEAAADYCQMVELAGYPVTALVALLVYRSTQRRMPLRQPSLSLFCSCRDDDNNKTTVCCCSCSSSSDVDNDPLWLFHPEKRQNQHCGCGLADCGTTKCYFVVCNDGDDTNVLSPILDAIRDYSATLHLRYHQQQQVASAHWILGEMAEHQKNSNNKVVERSDPCATIRPPLPPLLMFWNDTNHSYVALSLPFQLLAVKLFYLVMPAIAIEAVVRMNMDDDILSQRRYKSHRAFYVFILSLTLGERIKPQRKRQLPFSHEPLWDKLWNCSSKESTGVENKCFLQRFEHLLLSLQTGSGTEHENAPLFLPPPFAPSATPLYFVGDSHVLALAWQTLVIPDTCAHTVLIVPALVTGLKAWHVRKETRFFTHTTLQAWISRVPSRLFAFSAGEIDCREGIGGPLLEGYTTTCDDHVRATVREYIAALREHTKQQCVLLVLPVAPHLHRSVRKGRVVGQASRREAMRIWNGELRRQLLPLHDDDNQLVLLDYTHHLLVKSGNGDGTYTLNPLFNADGTHMNAAFAPLFINSLMECMDTCHPLRDRVRRFLATTR